MSILPRVLAIALVTVASVPRAEENHVRATLVADAAEVRAGHPFHIGVLLEPEPGWHVYWRNPGGAGLATELVFDLPDGFVADDLRWPIPAEFEQPGGIVGYGYEEPVVLAAEVTAPEPVGPPVPVELTVSWLACKAVCVLGSATLGAELPLKGPTLERSSEVLEDWKAKLPAPFEVAPFDATITGGPVPESGAVDLTIWLNWWRGREPAEIEIFPDPGSGLKVENWRVRTRGSLTRADLRLSRLKTLGPPATSLRALVVTRAATGDRQGSVTHFHLE